VDCIEQLVMEIIGVLSEHGDETAGPIKACNS
jgi:hypothetical protein